MILALLALGITPAVAAPSSAPAGCTAPARVLVRTRGSGQPLPGVTISSGDQTLGQTGADGALSLGEAQLSADCELTARSADHLPLSLTLDPHSKSTLKLWLHPRPPAYEVVVEAFRQSSHVSRQVVDAEQAFETPGVYEDAVRLVQALPSVTTQREYTSGKGDLSVRGSEGPDNRVLLDGIEVPYLYHFNQYASVFPASQVDKLTLISSAPGPMYGDAVGAIVDVQSTRDAPDALHGSAMLNFIVGGADVRAPLGKGWWFSAAGRRSYQDLAGSATDQYALWPTFHDATVRVEHGDAKRGTGLFFMEAGDRYTRAVAELDVLDPVERDEAPDLAFQKGFQIAGLRHHWDSGSEAGRFVLAVQHERLFGEISGDGGLQDERRLLVTNRLDARERWSERFGWEAGYELRISETALEVANPGPDRARVAVEVPALARGIPVDGRLARLQGGTYGVLDAHFGNVRWMPGVHLGFDSLGAVLPQARQTLRWHLAKQTELQLVVGRYAQRPDDALLVPDSQRDLPTTWSSQAVVAVEQTIANRLELQLQLYQKWLDAPLANPLDQPVYAFDKGQARGGELTARYRIRETFFAWGWIGTSWVRYAAEDGQRVRGSGDQPISAGLVLSWDFAEHWSAGLRWRYGSGLPWTPVASSLYDANRDAWVPTYAPLNSARLPGFQKIDLRIAYKWILRRGTLSLAGEAWIVPPSSAQLYPIWSDDYALQDFVRGPVVLPLLSVRATY